MGNCSTCIQDHAGPRVRDSFHVPLISDPDAAREIQSELEARVEAELAAELERRDGGNGSAGAEAKEANVGEAATTMEVHVKQPSVRRGGGSIS